jgi:hypothetical protein
MPESRDFQCVIVFDGMGVWRTESRPQRQEPQHSNTKHIAKTSIFQKSTLENP